jgi:hypothetical protein
VAFALPAQATPLPRYGIFVYSDVCWEKESGDAAGNRLMIIRDGDGDRLFWEWSEGPLEGPVPATAVRLKSGRIAFDVDIGSQDFFKSGGEWAGRGKPDIRHFSGTISSAAIVIGDQDSEARGVATDKKFCRQDG